MSTMKLFIKRIELTESSLEFIREMFENNSIGYVSEVEFIKKQNIYNGHIYNGAIVTFNSWQENEYTINLFSEMAEAIDGTTRFYYTYFNYWIICIHKPKIIEENIEHNIEEESCMTNSESILKAKYIILEKELEQYKRKLEQKNIQETQLELQNMELRSQIEELHEQLKKKHKNET